MSFNIRLFRRHLEEDETLVTITHRHWLMGARSLFWPVLAFVAGILLLIAAPYRSVAIGVGMWSSCVLLWLVRNFLDYYLDAWIITDQAIIDVAWFGWFHRESSRVLFSDIQGVSYEIKGVLPTLLRYGTISVEKISTGASISLDTVPRPRKVEAVILRCMEEYLHSKNLKDAKQVQELLSSVLARELQQRELQGEDEDDEE
ncbi:PH domain-containing protein [Candidatus Peribacteria bacterium]|nr:PH domain-containing protein [Candidatus Peribacteria bacterium]